MQKSRARVATSAAALVAVIVCATGCALVGGPGISNQTDSAETVASPGDATAPPEMATSWCAAPIDLLIDYGGGPRLDPVALESIASVPALAQTLAPGGCAYSRPNVASESGIEVWVYYREQDLSAARESVSQLALTLGLDRVGESGENGPHRLTRNYSSSTGGFDGALLYTEAEFKADLMGFPSSADGDVLGVVTYSDY